MLNAVITIFDRSGMFQKSKIKEPFWCSAAEALEFCKMKVPAGHVADIEVYDRERLAGYRKVLP